MRGGAQRVTEILGEGGLLAKVVDGYDWRPAQLEMGRAVWDAFARERILLVEAPTGVGKTMAYLVPAALHARRHHEPVVVSSYTRTLQDQILLQEAPRLRRLIHPDLRIVSLKGRSNYLCKRGWELFVAEEGSGADGRRVVDRLSEWVYATESGDFSEAPDFGGRAAWVLARIGGDARFCRSRLCRAETGCFHKQARRAAHDAQIVVVNHSLLLADALGGSVLPEHRALIVDEAHLLPDAALEPLSLRVSRRSLLDKIGLIGGAGEPGVSDRVRRALRGLPGRVASRNLTRRVRDLEEQTRMTLGLARGFWLGLAATPGFPPEGERRRYGAGPGLDALLPRETDACLDAVAALCETGRRLVEEAATERPAAAGGEEYEDSLEAAQVSIGELEEEIETLRKLLAPDARDRVYCLEVSASEGPALSAVPLNPGPAIRALILDRHAAVVMTSATLTATSGFDYIAAQLGLGPGEAKTAQLPSPFHLPEQLRTFVPTYAADPRGPGYVAGLADTIGRLARAVPHKTLALFTARETLAAVAAALAPMDGLADVEILAQGRDGTRAQLVERFRRASRAVLLGTASFWHGVDFPGEELELLIVTRLPFPVPVDPRVEAISAALEENGLSSFTNYALPEAVLRFRQGLGRLIRRASDRGVCVVLDPRLVRANYGRDFAAVLPAPPEEVATPEALIAGVRQWLQRSDSDRSSGGAR